MNAELRLDRILEGNALSSGRAFYFLGILAIAFSIFLFFNRPIFELHSGETSVWAFLVALLLFGMGIFIDYNRLQDVLEKGKRIGRFQFFFVTTIWWLKRNAKKLYAVCLSLLFIYILVFLPMKAFTITYGLALFAVGFSARRLRSFWLRFPKLQWIAIVSITITQLYIASQIHCLEWWEFIFLVMYSGLLSQVVQWLAFGLILIIMGKLLVPQVILDIMGTFFFDWFDRTILMIETLLIAIAYRISTPEKRTRIREGVFGLFVAFNFLLFTFTLLGIFAPTIRIQHWP